jgi:hypothetical protein
MKEPKSAAYRHAASAFTHYTNRTFVDFAFAGDRDTSYFVMHRRSETDRRSIGCRFF